MLELPPLAGFTVGVTADRLQAEQVELLRRRGADVLVAPTVRTVPLVDDDRLRDAVDDLIVRPPEITVGLTGVGVRSLVAAAESMGRGDDLLAAMAGSTVVARGPKAAGALAAAGLDVSWRASSARSSELATHLAGPAARGVRIAIQRDGDGRAWLAESLAALGAEVVDVPVYRWQLPDDTAPALRLIQAIRSGAVDAVTFTSSPAVRNLVDLAGGGAGPGSGLSVLDHAVPVYVGPVCAETGAALGLGPGIAPSRARLGSMVQALAAAFAGRGRRVSVVGGELVVQGSAVVVDDEVVRLPERERDVLRVLVGAAGTVVPKARLLRDVWPDEALDEHVVEVTVGRLRRRLGPLGHSVQTVSRRGYRLLVAGRDAAAPSSRPD